MMSRREFFKRALAVAACTPFIRHAVPLFRSTRPLKSGPQMIPIKDIVVDPSLSCRLYPHDAEHLQALMDSIRDVGLMSPIIVDTNRLLLSGFARIEACRRLGHTEIMCQVFVAGEELRVWHNLIDNKVRHQFPIAAAGFGLLAGSMRAEDDEDDEDDLADDDLEEDEDDLDDLDDDMDDFPDDDDDDDDEEED